VMNSLRLLFGGNKLFRPKMDADQHR
jgi:hypothetical protein